MVLVFIFCAIIIFITLVICLIILSTVKLKIRNFSLSNMNSFEKQNEQKEQKENNDKQIKSKQNSKYEIEISMYFCNKIKWIWIRLNSERLRKMYNKVQLEKIDIRKMEKEFKLIGWKEIKKMKPKISLFHLDLSIGTEDVLITTFIVSFITTFISILLPYTIEKYQKERYRYMIEPIFMNKNVYKIQFDCIFEIKMVHIINIIYVFLKKRRGEKNERTSNRRSYGYSYE